ncbi:CPBP family intramembrane glutamic endopeptidase [Maricaulis sp.]|uniref:CPBP family intramembrane glutamic endopeptidase n=1 Tax=Maricaulis sp. TaxID=1486257 RepID=UPI002B271895|nr:CPBP family intramembrane glutamic endopeptidase [Maricaulis sp.]
MQTLTQTPSLILGLLAIAAVLIAGLVSDIRDKRRAPEDARPVMHQYRKTGLVLWLLCATCLGCWHVAGLPLTGLGLTAATGWGGALAWTLAGATIVYGLYSLVTTALDRTARSKLRRQLAEAEGFDLLRPRRLSEHLGFQALSVTAGITEEVIFRGFLMATLALMMPLWAAALASVSLFIIAHAYQGISGMLRILPITVLMTAVVLLGGSLWPAMLIHVVVDALAGCLVALTDAHARADDILADAETADAPAASASPA